MEIKYRLESIAETEFKIDYDFDYSGFIPENLKVQVGHDIKPVMDKDQVVVKAKASLVYGDEEVLSNLTYIPVEIDVTGLKENKEYKVELNKPVGVNSLSINNLTINVSLGEISSKDINDVGITPKNLGENYKAQSVDESGAKVTVNVKGVKNVIDQIKSTDINAYIDLSGLTEGEHEVDVLVEGNDSRVTYTSKTKKVKIKITKK